LTLDALAEAGVIAVIRAGSADAAVAVAEAVLRGGLCALEITFTTPGAIEAIGRLARQDAIVGAGTVTEPGQAAAAVAAGARFLVSPGTDDPILAQMV
jgi:2-dehydro-3-deoxyphosphogluconate aldolase/(4S)-4-hydroxy-2-oxoglutarate aldolase